jgi:hypothetical protein
MTHSLLTTGKQFYEVLADIEARQARSLPDQIVHVAELRAASDTQLILPSGQILKLNPWSRKQLASMLGIRWNKFFENITESERAALITAKFGRIPGEVKIRAYAAERSGDPGLLRAILPPTYTAIDDLRVFRTLQRMLSGKLEQYLFRRSDVTPSGSFYQAYRLGGVRVRDEMLFPGFILKNSEVGGSALTLDEAWYRPICANGLVLPVGDKRVLFRTHRTIEEETLAATLVIAISRFPDRWQTGAKILHAAHDLVIKHPDDAVAAVLDNAGIPRELVKKAQEAALRSRATTAFDVSQAITLVAHTENDDPHLRFLLERCAGEYLVANVTPASNDTPAHVEIIETPRLVATN